MKKVILALALMMSIGATQTAWASSAPKHRYHPTTQQVDKQAASAQQADKQAASAQQADKQAASAQQPESQDEDGLEAYSDTTDTDTTAEDASYADDDDARSYHSKYSLGNYDDPFDFLGSVFGGGTLAFVIFLCILIGLLFFLAPIIIIFIIVRYLMRRHNDHMKLAEMAMEKGINVPESQRPIDKQSDEYLVKRGLRNTFLGIGLCAMFAWWGSSFLAGIGALVGIYGVGQVIIGSLPAIKDWWNNRHGNNGAGYTGTSI